MEGICKLCGKHSTLQKSHIIPSFVIQWLKESSATGYIRYGDVLNKRVQDGIKIYLLCEDCEQLFGKYEKAFSENIFNPLNNGKPSKDPYGPWLLKFATSVSWRVLTFLKGKVLSHYPLQHKDAVEHALEVWREYLLSKRRHPGKHEQHILFLGAIKKHTFDELPTNINRYLLRVIDMDAIYTDDTAHVYTKMGPVVIVGSINVPKSKEWVGTKIHVKHGNIVSPKYTLPLNFGNYLQDRARNCEGFYNKISKKQANKINQAYDKDIDKVVKSKTWEAMAHDVDLFGDKAFTKTNKK